MKEVIPDYVIPIQGSGAAFSRMVQREMPDKLILSSTETRHIFGA